MRKRPMETAELDSLRWATNHAAIGARLTGGAVDFSPLGKLGNERTSGPFNFLGRGVYGAPLSSGGGGSDGGGKVHFAVLMAGER